MDTRAATQCLCNRNTGSEEPSEMLKRLVHLC